MKTFANNDMALVTMLQKKYGDVPPLDKLAAQFTPPPSPPPEMEGGDDESGADEVAAAAAAALFSLSADSPMPQTPQTPQTPSGTSPLVATPASAESAASTKSDGLEEAEDEDWYKSMFADELQLDGGLGLDELGSTTTAHQTPSPAKPLLECQVCLQAPSACECPWLEAFDRKKDRCYYYHRHTMQTTWDLPEEMKARAAQETIDKASKHAEQMQRVQKEVAKEADLREEELMVEEMGAVYENQRYIPLAGWGQQFLPTDPFAWSSEDGKAGGKAFEAYQHGKIKSDYTLIMDDHTDAKGWQYAIAFPSKLTGETQWKPKKFTAAMVRRRRWNAPKAETIGC
jgi:hypothetical protein